MKNDASLRAHNQWASRPDDERFVSLLDMVQHFEYQRAHSKALVASTHGITVRPDESRTLRVYGANGYGYEPTHWSFGQLCQLAGAPAGYLRTLPPELVSDDLTYGLRYNRGPEDIGLLLSKNGSEIVRAATGPNYGRIWNEQVVKALVAFVGDGVSGTWKVPGEFGKNVEVNKRNTTLYASDRDMFVFLADEENRIAVPHRRDGKDGSLARGIYIWNSEVGAAKFGIGLFLFDFICCNRIVWGLDQYKEITIRHTQSAPHRYLEEIQPALETYSQASPVGIEDAIKSAQAQKLDDVNTFLANRFGPRVAEVIAKTHELEEGGRPIETRWDVITAATAYARVIPHQDVRLEVEKQAGELLKV